MTTKTPNGPEFDGATVLVTGACGFIGSHLVERLVEQGARVTALDNLQSGHWENLGAAREQVDCREVDVRAAETIQQTVQTLRPHYVFHLAANASVPGSVQDPVYDFQSNAVGTFNVLQALRDITECRKAVVASSGAVYGEPAAFPILESHPLLPISPYGASKLSTEITAQIMQRVYGVPAVIARIFNTYGPRMARFVILDFLRKLQRDPDRLEVLGTGQQIRDFTFVADTVAGLMLLARRGEPGTPYNLSSGANTSVTDLARRMIAALGLEERTQIAYTGNSWVGDAQRWEVCIDRIKELGYRACFPLDAGLKETIAWFEQQAGERSG